jgi:hypothetical protein
MQHSVPSHQTYPGRWIERRGIVHRAPRIPDLNPLDYTSWGYMMLQVHSIKIASVAHLKQQNEETCQSITADILKKIQNNIKFHMQTYIKIEGANNKQIL